MEDILKELKFSRNDDISSNEVLKDKNMFRTTYAYMISDIYDTYVGIVKNNIEYIFIFNGMSPNEVQARMKFKRLKTNRDKDLSVFDKNRIRQCKRIVESRYEVSKFNNRIREKLGR